MQTFRYGNKRTEHPSNEGEYIEVDEKDSCYEDVIQKFNEHYVPRVNKVHESIVFNKRVQSDTESVDDFLSYIFSLMFIYTHKIFMLYV